MKTFLIPVPRQPSFQRLREQLSIIAKPGVDKLHLLHITTFPPGTDGANFTVISAGQIMADIAREEEIELSKLATQFKSIGFSVETHCPIGFFEQEFINYANKISPDYILMFTHGAHNWFEDLLGTNVSHVFKQLKSPLFVFPEETKIMPFKKAEVALDMELDDPAILADVIRLSDELNFELNYVKVDSKFELNVIPDSSMLNKLQHAYPGKIEYVAHTAEKDPAKGLEKYAEESGCDLIVLFTTKRNFIDQLFHKSVTKNLVKHSKIPLLIYHYEEK
jgi:nucleotide-binding universal stress UspA family protein